MDLRLKYACFQCISFIRRTEHNQSDNIPLYILFLLVNTIIYTNGKKKLCILKNYIYIFMTGYLIYY
jgi:hypothetical protein